MTRKDANIKIAVEYIRMYEEKRTYQEKRLDDQVRRHFTNEDHTAKVINRLA